MNYFYDSGSCHQVSPITDASGKCINMILYTYLLIAYSKRAASLSRVRISGRTIVPLLVGSDQ